MLLSPTRGGTTGGGHVTSSLEKSLRQKVGEDAPVQVTTADKPTNISRRTVVNAIVAETGCTRSAARQMISWLTHQLNKARASRIYISHPYTNEMSGPSYALFEQVIPHDAKPAVGSAHAALNRYLLRGNELNIAHRQIADGADEAGTHCAVEVEINKVN